MNTHEVIRKRLLDRAGLSEPPKCAGDMRQLMESEWSPAFERHMRARLVMGALRYGTLEHKRRSGHKWDLLGAVSRKLERYKQTGNTELLVDAANYLLLEFEVGKHPGKHFSATDDKDHCKVMR